MIIDYFSYLCPGFLCRMNILSVNRVGHAYGGPQLLDEATLHIQSGDRICLLGRNGAGKSTLLHLLNGDIAPDRGDIQRQQGIRSAYVPQEFPVGLQGPVASFLLGTFSRTEQNQPQARILIDQTLSRLDLTPDSALESMSGGLKRRALLAAALVHQPDLLLLDEPTNHLDIEAIRWLEDFLLRLPITLVFVSHDRSFIARLATRIVELDRGRLQDYRCDYPAYLQRREDVLNAEEQAHARFDRKLAEEEAWIRKGIKARRTRNMGRVRDLQKMREQRRRRRERTGSVRLHLDEAEKSGRMVIETRGLVFRYGDSPIVANLDLRIMRGDRIGLIGPNGSGKTTLLKLLTGELQPSAGRVRHGTNLQIAYFDQLRDQLDENRSVKDNLADGRDQVLINGQARHIYGYLQDFLFTPERARTPVRVLSGGEKNRLLLARLFTRPANLLILDEPTNDLDLETLDLLEELLHNFQGTVLLVSHDRSFLNNLVTSSLVFHGRGRIEEIIGGYDDWLTLQKMTEPPPKSKPRKDQRKPARARKLSFKEKRELETLPTRIDQLESEQAELHQTLAEPALYQEDDGARVIKLNQRLKDIEQELEESYLRWQELEEIPE